MIWGLEGCNSTYSAKAGGDVIPPFNGELLLSLIIEGVVLKVIHSILEPDLLNETDNVEAGLVVGEVSITQLDPSGAISFKKWSGDPKINFFISSSIVAVIKVSKKLSENE
ncbi:hypothetical protein O181_118137 [Austropuccinia psidii MF-1]|uniref:Uncharacterized protein n=1 Tax=Austropuccinia psidii MF-1 TaxID=1389203 RepID=A0A9Q3Q037_9BASI|nr:hypothetical protein [Austropuccinia psidii MF-1]